jgi:hypothetical protein
MLAFKHYVTHQNRWVQAEHLALAEAPATMPGFCLTASIAWLMKCNEIGAEQALAALGQGDSKQSYAMARQLMWNEYQHGWHVQRHSKPSERHEFFGELVRLLSVGRLVRLPFFRAFRDLPSFLNAIRECVGLGARQMLIGLRTEQHAVAVWMTEADFYALDVNWGMAGCSRLEPKAQDIVSSLLASYLLLYKRFWSEGYVYPVMSTVLPPREAIHAGSARRSSIASGSRELPPLSRKKTL